MNLKYILIVIVLATIIGGGTLAYQYWWLPKEEAKISEIKPPEVKPPEEVPPEDKTTNWKSFTNTEFGYSFKYPSTYIVKGYGTDVQVYESSNTNAQHIVGFYGQKTNATLSSIIKDKTDGRVLSEARPTTINGLSAYEGIDQGIVSSYAVFVKDNSNLIEIIFGSTDRDDLQKSKSALTDTQKLILSTFSFTK